MGIPTALQLDFLPAAQLAIQPSGWWRNVLGVVGFEKLPEIEHGRVPLAASMTPSLGETSNLCEVWRIGGADRQLSNGSLRESRVHYRYCDDLLFGSIRIDAQELGGVDCASLLRVTQRAYRDIFTVLQETEHRHLIRIWNYLPEINRETGGDERYRHFNAARRAAFRDSGRATVGSVPAASALGSPAGSPIAIYFLAARSAPLTIENPRQTSAYDYPPKFGRHSPIFSRACLLRDFTGTNLFISGTASIVGHETLHVGNVAAQTRESIANINALLGQANRIVGAARYALEDLKFKVYVRRPDDLGAIKQALSGALRAAQPIVYLQADVCREDLLVEIEATGESAAVNRDLSALRRGGRPHDADRRPGVESRTASSLP